MELAFDFIVNGASEAEVDPNLRLKQSAKATNPVVLGEMVVCLATKPVGADFERLQRDVEGVVPTSAQVEGTYNNPVTCLARSRRPSVGIDPQKG